MNPADTTGQRPSPRDLTVLLPRRQIFRLLGGVGLTALVAACGSDDSSGNGTTASTPGSTAAPTTPGSTAASTTGATTGSTTAATTGTTATGASADCDTAIPEETAGPFPGDGSNGPNVLTEDGVVRQDIRSSFGSAAAGTADGVPLTIELDLVESGGRCGPLANAAVYLWHCDRDGRYSIYSQGVTDQNYLRGVQVAGADGKVAFTTIYPGCYSGRWPHAHFEVYASEADATGGADPIATSQVAFPQDTCEQVYATAGYETSAGNLGGLSLATDNVFRDDGAVHQLGTVSGSVDRGLSIRLTVPV